LRRSAQTALGLVELADVFEDLAAGGRRLVGLQLVLGLPDQRAQLLAISFGVLLDKLLQDFVGTVDQPVAPAFQIVETLVVLAGGSVELVKERRDGVDVLVTHQLADERPVTTFGLVCRVLLVLFKRRTQFVGQRQFGQGIGLERGKALAHIDQRLHLALDLGFAFFAIKGGVVRINHGGSPLRIAAMITSRGPLVRPGRSKTLTERRI